MRTAQQYAKDPLFAGLAREARAFGLPVNVFVFFLFAAFFVFFAVKAVFGGFLKPILAVTIVFAVLTALTYQEDRGVGYAWFKLYRQLRNSKKMFHGYSYETGYRRKSVLRLHYQFSREAEGEKMEVSKLPYLFHISPNIIKLANGDLMTTIELDGLNFETESYDELAALKKFRADLYRQLNSRLVTYIHYIRSEAQPERHEDIGQDFFDAFEAKYFEQQQKTKVFTNRIFITLVARRNNPNAPGWERLRHIFTLDSSSNSLLKLLDRSETSNTSFL